MSVHATVDEAFDAATRLLARHGVSDPVAAGVAQALITAERMGHRTHGLSLLPQYLREIDNGVMAREGRYDILRDGGGALWIDAAASPGGWVIPEVMKIMTARLPRHGVATAAIANCFHIGALIVYLLEPARQGCFCQIMATDPCIRSMAPHGGVDPVTTTNPIACGAPTEGDPILIDLTTTVVSNAVIRNSLAAGERLPGPWVKDNRGRYTDDPAAIRTDPPGSIAPLGGEEFGYKGFALSLMVEAAALALSGFGRTEPRKLFTEGVFIQIIDPDAFAGKAVFRREMQDLCARVAASAPADGAEGAEGAAGPRVPGRRALDELARTAREGLTLPSPLAEILGFDG